MCGEERLTILVLPAQLDQGGNQVEAPLGGVVRVRSVQGARQELEDEAAVRNHDRRVGHQHGRALAHRRRKRGDRGRGERLRRGGIGRHRRGWGQHLFKRNLSPPKKKSNPIYHAAMSWC